MMKKLLLGLFCAYFIGNLQAQVTILDTDMGSVGDQFITATDTNVMSYDFSSSAGASQTWDFTGLAVHGIDTVNFLDPAMTPSGGDFPTASVCVYQSGSSQYNYIQVSPSALEVIGVAGDITGQGVILSAEVNPSRSLLVFPFTFGTTYLDTSMLDQTIPFTAIPFVDSARYKSITYLDGLGDAWGTLILSSGTYNSVRLREISRSVDSIWIHNSFTGWTLFDNTDVTDSSFSWWDKTRGFVLATATVEDDTTRDIAYLDPNPVAVCDCNWGDFVTAYPVPTNNGRVIISSSQPFEGDLEIVDVRGAILGRYRWTGEKQELDLMGWSPGLYFYRLKDAQSGKQYAGRIVLQ